MRIGYLIPEFPGQTHIIVWREIQALESMGASLDLVSTRPVTWNTQQEAWAAKAIERTLYLAKWHLNDVLAAIVEMMRSGPGGLLRCSRAIRDAEGGSKLRLLAFALVGARLSYLARKHRWEWVHVHSCADSANVALFAFLLSGIPYSIILHGPLKDYGQNQKQKWENAAFAFVITRALDTAVKSELAGHLPAHIEISPMGVNIAVLHRTTPYKAWAGGEIRIFSCGRLNIAKGHLSLIEAIAILRSKGLEVVLDIAGEDEQGGTGYRRELERRIAELDLGKAVRLHGVVSEATVAKYLEGAHAFALASLDEPLGVAIMEAMAMEVPVVMARSKGVMELVDDGMDGILVEPGSPEAMARAIADLLRDRELALRLSRQGRVKVKEKFQSKGSAEKLLRSIGRSKNGSIPPCAQ